MVPGANKLVVDNKPEVTLFAPGLLSRHAGSPELRRFLSRADHQLDSTPSVLRHFDLFGVRPAPNMDLPVASVTRIADMGVVDRDWWIRADPVYLEPRRDSLILHPEVGLDIAESQELAAELNESLALDGWVLRAPAPARWYVRPPEGWKISTVPLDAAAGQNVEPLLPSGPDRSLWHSRLTEIQILLHTSPVNADRERRGLLPANSVWFWGGGRLPEIPRSRWQEIFGADPVTRGLSRLSGVAVQPVPDGAAEWGGAPGPGPSLVVFEPLNTPAGLSVDDFAGRWVSPLARAVHRGDLGALTLATDHGPVFRYVRSHRWRLWRRGRSLSSWRREAA